MEFIFQIFANIVKQDLDHLPLVALKIQKREDEIRKFCIIMDQERELPTFISEGRDPTILDCGREYLKVRFNCWVQLVLFLDPVFRLQYFHQLYDLLFGTISVARPAFNASQNWLQTKSKSGGWGFPAFDHG